MSDPVKRRQKPEASEGTWGQRFFAVGQKACTEVGRHPFRTVYISAVAQRGRNSALCAIFVILNTKIPRF